MRRTPFYQFHADHGAKFVEFAGYEMPIMYRSIIEEHHQVRNSGGLFDVSHMGRFKISGRHARRLLDRTVTRRIADMKDKTCRYGLVCNERGGVMDDVIVYKFEYHYLLVVNASNRDKILAHLQKVAADGNLGVKIEDQTDSTAMVALQGPKVMEEIGKFSSEVPTLKRYAFCEKNLLVLKMLISRTGYTGEDGVEVIMNAGMASKAIKLLVKTEAAEGKSIAIAPAGLGARDTLRIEAAMPLYGHELSEDIDPLSAGLNFAVSLDKADDERGEPFIGMEALKKIQSEGLKQKRVGLKLEGKRTARQHMKVLKGDTAIGEVTSGCLSPTLGYPIAMAFIDAQAADTGDRLTVELGSSRAEAQVVALPFYKRA